MNGMMYLSHHAGLSQNSEVSCQLWTQKQCIDKGIFKRRRRRSYK